MPRSKTQVSKLPLALRTPIDDGWPSLGLNDDELKAWFAQSHARVFAQSIIKLDLLMDELKIPQADEPAIRWVLLSLALARKLYPGFLTLTEAKPNGRPRRGQRHIKVGEIYMPGGGNSLAGDPKAALALVEIMRKRGAVASDLEACEMLLTSEDSNLSSPRRRLELEKRARSLASVISTTRTSAKRKIAGKLN